MSALSNRENWLKVGISSEVESFSSQLMSSSFRGLDLLLPVRGTQFPLNCKCSSSKSWLPFCSPLPFFSLTNFGYKLLILRTKTVFASPVGLESMYIYTCTWKNILYLHTHACTHMIQRQFTSISMPREENKYYREKDQNCSSLLDPRTQAIKSTQSNSQSLWIIFFCIFPLYPSLWKNTMFCRKWIFMISQE